MRKSLMGIPTLLTVIVVAGVIALIPLSHPPLPIAASSDSDDSDTNAEQRLKQKNLGSGDSRDFNCDENMIESTSDNTECIPSGPEPPTPSAQPFTINGGGSGDFRCIIGDLGGISISAQGEEDGTVTGTVTLLVIGGASSQNSVTGGTTDGNTFSLTGQSTPGFCGDASPFTVSGGCGNDVMISYADSFFSGTYIGNVECTLL
jgi:hypothetical protein